MLFHGRMTIIRILFSILGSFLFNVIYFHVDFPMKSEPALKPTKRNHYENDIHRFGCARRNTRPCRMRHVTNWQKPGTPLLRKSAFTNGRPSIYEHERIDHMI